MIDHVTAASFLSDCPSVCLLHTDIVKVTQLSQDFNMQFLILSHKIWNGCC